MPHRHADRLAVARAPLAAGLRARLSEGYSRADAQADLLAGLVVGVVALPLSMALAIASGVPPQHGLYTAIIAGIAAALLGGTRAQVTGPTAAFVVLLVPIVTRFGLGGLLLSGLLAGVILVGMGVLGLGRLIQFIPHPVTTGFTTGIAVVIGTIQLKDALGLEYAGTPESFPDRLRLMWEARHTIALPELGIAGLTILLLLLLPEWTRRSRWGWVRQLPAPLLALAAATVAGALLPQVLPGTTVATIGSRFTAVVAGETVHGIPPLPPLPLLPWALPGAGGTPLPLTLQTLEALLPSAFAIAMLGAIESLLAAVVADGMTGRRHDPNAELVGLGIANILCPFFGGIPATGALARTATNIRAGATSPFAAVFHALFVLACTVFLAPVVAWLPMAALAGLLLVVARNMAELPHFQHIVKVAPRSDVVVLLTCFALTVLFDMVVAVGVGVGLAALLFMRRMAEIAESRVLDAEELQAHGELPPGVRMYEIAGPLFFGAAEKAMAAFGDIGGAPGGMILVLTRVPAIDATGLVALETLLARLRRAGHRVVLAGVQRQPLTVLARANIHPEPGVLGIVDDLPAALAWIRAATPP